MSNIPAELKYTASHEWIRTEGDLYVIGLTDFAQSSLGDIVFIELPQEGDAVTMGESFADVESVKAVSGVFSPVSGTVAAVNSALIDNPAMLNEDPYGAWLVKVSDVTETGELLDGAGYEAVCKSEEA